MKIRRYLGSNTQEAILKVKMDLGNEALILNTRKVRQKGLFKIFSKPMVEVLAAIDENYVTRKEKEQQRQNDRGPDISVESQETKELAEKDEKITKLEDKVNSMETLLQKVYEQLLTGESKAEITEGQGNASETTPLRAFYNNMVKNEVETEIAKKITDAAEAKVGKNAGLNETASVICNMLSGVLGKAETIRIRDDGKPTVVIFLGPTGVGKTTTLAKIAANYVLNQRKKIGLITADTYRIAAVEQLKTYAEILGIPVSVIYSPAEIQEAINQYSDMDLVLIDTAGRSYKNKQQFDELKTLIAAANANEVFLVLSATTSMLNCREILKHYSFLKDYKLIFTKIDEAPAEGIILNTKIITGKTISYITTGQSVPDDIEVANAEKLAKNILGSIK